MLAVDGKGGVQGVITLDERTDERKREMCCLSFSPQRVKANRPVSPNCCYCTVPTPWRYPMPCT